MTNVRMSKKDHVIVLVLKNIDFTLTLLCQPYSFPLLPFRCWLTECKYKLSYFS